MASRFTKSVASTRRLLATCNNVNSANSSDAIRASMAKMQAPAWNFENFEVRSDHTASTTGRSFDLHCELCCEFSEFNSHRNSHWEIYTVNQSRLWYIAIQIAVSIGATVFESVPAISHRPTSSSFMYLFWFETFKIQLRRETGVENLATGAHKLNRCFEVRSQSNRRFPTRAFDSENSEQPSKDRLVLIIETIFSEPKQPISD